MDSLIEYFDLRVTTEKLTYQVSIPKEHKELLELVFEPRNQNKGLHVLSGRLCSETVKEIEDAIFCCNLTKSSNRLAVSLHKLHLLASKEPEGRWWLV